MCTWLNLDLFRVYGNTLEDIFNEGAGLSNAAVVNFIPGNGPVIPSTVLVIHWQ